MLCVQDEELSHLKVLLMYNREKHKMNLKLLFVFLSNLTFIFSCTSISENKANNESNLITSESLSQVNGQSWHLSHISEQGKMKYETNKPHVTLTFKEKCKVDGKAPVNNYFGGCELDKNGLLVWQQPGFGMTMMAGPPELMEQETYYLNTLAKTSRMYLTAQGLRLENNDGSLKMEFIQLKP